MDMLRTGFVVSNGPDARGNCLVLWLNCKLEMVPAADLQPSALWIEAGRPKETT